jgi:hypothetical protein
MTGGYVSCCLVLVACTGWCSSEDTREAQVGVLVGKLRCLDYGLQTDFIGLSPPRLSPCSSLPRVLSAQMVVELCLLES